MRSRRVHARISLLPEQIREAVRAVCCDVEHASGALMPQLEPQMVRRIDREVAIGRERADFDEVGSFFGL